MRRQQGEQPINDNSANTLEVEASNVKRSFLQRSYVNSLKTEQSKV